MTHVRWLASQLYAWNRPTPPQFVKEYTIKTLFRDSVIQESLWTGPAVVGSLAQRGNTERALQRRSLCLTQKTFFVYLLIY